MDRKSIPSERIHLILFGLIGFLFTKDNLEDRLVKIIPFSLLFGFFAASVDEMFQLFLPYRVGDIRDVLFGGLGSLWGSIVCISVKFRYKDIIAKLMKSRENQ